MEQLRGLGCCIEHVVYETGPTWFSLCHGLRNAGFNASVVATLLHSPHHDSGDRAATGKGPMRCDATQEHLFFVDLIA